jgi:hypothetical protein
MTSMCNGYTGWISYKSYNPTLGDVITSLEKFLSSLIDKITKCAESFFQTIQSRFASPPLPKNEKKCYRVIEPPNKMTANDYIRDITLLHLELKGKLYSYHQSVASNPGATSYITVNQETETKEKNEEEQIKKCQHNLLSTVYNFCKEYPQEFAQEVYNQKESPFMLDFLSIQVIHLLNNYGPQSTKKLIENLEKEISELKLKDDNANAESKEKFASCKQELIERFKSNIINGVSLPIENHIEGSDPVKFRLNSDVQENFARDNPLFIYPLS